jgi:SNF2 family DNA or RNA helicase
MLDLVDLLCDEHGFETSRYTGGASLKQRDEALRRFKYDPDCSIMLTSLRAGGVGLNLTQANLVISVDMWWNAAVEHQAFDRVHRLGQTKEVIVTRFVVKETVEERIKVLQEGKLMVAAAAMGEGLGRVSKLGTKELMGLFVSLDSFFRFSRFPPS